ncbi:hypothetical protein MKW92_049822, partial [Papaver armeniacum]
IKVALFTPGGEFHAGLIFCYVGMLTIMGSLHHIDMVLLGWWLCERRVKSGGLNGRPGMRPDVCYSVWVISSLILIDEVHWIDKDKLVGFILHFKDKENGGMSDRPDDVVDVSVHILVLLVMLAWTPLFDVIHAIFSLSLLEYPEIKVIEGKSISLTTHVDACTTTTLLIFKFLEIQLLF